MGWEAHEGKQRSSEPMTVEAELLARYAAGIAETNRRHADTEHPGFSGPPLLVANSIIPGTGALLMDLDLGAKLMRIVHGGIELTFARPVLVGDALTCKSRFLGVDEKRSGELVNMGFEIKDAAGDDVCSGVTRYFLRGKKKEGEAPAPKPAPPADPGAPTHELTELVAEGQSLLYAEGSGDRFPIHTDKNFAQSVGLPDVILHGMCTLAFATRALVNTVLDGDSSRLKSLEVRFAKMVFHGDALTTRIWVDGSELSFVTLNQRGERVLEAGRASIA